MACGNLQMCAGLEDGIERATYAVGQQRINRVRAKRGHEDEEEVTEVDVVYRGEEIAEGLNNLNIEMGGTEEEASEGLEAALRMSSHDMEEEEDRGREEEDEVGDIQRALGALEFLT